MQENNMISIQKISALLKVAKPTLRFWEKELEGIFVPMRTNGGQRRYTVENIAVIEEIKKLKSKGMSLPEIKRRLEKGQMSEAGLRPIGAYAPVGSQISWDERTNSVDLLAARVAEVVKAEVNRFFEE